MLHLVRKHAHSWLIQAVLWTIILAFVGTIFYSWGMGGSTRLTGGVVATVGDREIHMNEYDQAFNNLVDFYRQQFKDRFSEQMIASLNLKTAAMDALIQKKLLLMEADRQNIQVSDTELASHISSIPAFQNEGKFSSRMYRNFLTFRRLTPLEFEESQREVLRVDKVQKLIQENVKVTPTEVMEVFKHEEEKVKLKMLAIPEDFFKDESEVTDEEKKDYYKKHKAEFEVPEKIKVQYVKITPESFAKDIELKDEDIEEFYNLKIADYMVKKQFKAHHILHRVETPSFDDKSSEEEKEKKKKENEEKVKKMADETLKKLKDGASFEEMAKEVSDDKASGNNGGDLGQFSTGTMVPEFESALDKLKPGELSEPVLSPFGYHIIRLDEKKEARTKPLSEVKDQVVKSLKEIKGRQRARRTAKHIKKLADNDKNLASAAKSKGVQVKETKFFSTDDRNLEDIGIAPKFYEQAFKLKVNEISETINTPKASFVLKVAEVKPPYVPEMKVVDDDLVKAVKKQKNRDATLKKFKELKDSISEENTLEKIAKDNGLSVRNTPLFNREDSIPGVGNIKEIKDKAFAMKLGGYASTTVRKRHYIFKLEERNKPGEPKEDQKLDIYNRLKTQKGNSLFQEWIDKLRNDMTERQELKIDSTLL